MTGVLATPVIAVLSFTSESHRNFTQADGFRLDLNGGADCLWRIRP